MVSIDIKYRILSVDESEHSFVIRYFTDDLTEDMLATIRTEEGDIARDANGYPVACRTDYNISLFKTPTPTGKELEEVIKLDRKSTRLNSSH